MKCSECKHAEAAFREDVMTCKLNPPATLGVPHVNQITGETSMAMQPTNPLVVQEGYDNGGCSHHSPVEVRLELS